MIALTSKTLIVSISLLVHKNLWGLSFSSFSAMASALKSLNLPHFLGKNYEISLNQSLEALLKSLGNPYSKKTSFMSDFRALVQSRADPPLETIWVFSALSFHSQRAPNAQLLDRILAIKDLFQLIGSCSASCSSGKSIALVAPVICNLHKFILEANGLQLGSKIERKVKSEIGSLVDSIVGYINVCCSGFEGGFDDSDGLIRPLSELISLWVVDEALRNENVESLRVFFPLLSDDVVKRVSEDGCGMLDLVGFVITEAFLLKLCWKIKEGFGEKMQNELKPWIVGSITGFRNSYFYGSILFSNYVCLYI